MDATPDPEPPSPRAARDRARSYALIAWVLMVANVGTCSAAWSSTSTAGDLWIWLFIAILAAQIGFGAAAMRRSPQERAAGKKWSLARVGGGLAVALGIVTAGLSALFVLAAGSGGGAWGRPLRIRGRQRHPSLKTGADWTAGPRPDPHGLDPDTRRALEALWLHDAQKEHASVPAFSRVAWLLAAAGAPAELLAWSHRAAIEEIEHARACFALAAGYGGRSFTVEPMPELLLGGLDGKVDPRVTLAIESLSDGCQLEDFNADVAAACAAVCEEPVARHVLDTIAREERSHAELSWAILAWLVGQHRAVVEAPIASGLAKLASYPRPTAVASDKRALVALASTRALRAHGRLADAEWAALWDARLAATGRRLDVMMASPMRAAA